MTILVQQQLRDAAQVVSLWSGSLTHAWKSLADDHTWIVGHVDEDGVQYIVAQVEADAYDYQGASEKLADFFRLANPAAVLALLDEMDKLRAENAELRKDKDRLDRGYIMTGVPGVNACEHRGVDLRAAIDRVTQLDEQRAQRQTMTREQP